MYLKFEDVTLVADTSNARPDDPVVYERELNGERILTPDFMPSRYAGPARRYGTLYYDARDQPCIVPDEWNEDDAMLARLALRID